MPTSGAVSPTSSTTCDMGACPHEKVSTLLGLILKHATYIFKFSPKLITKKDISKGLTYYLMTGIFHFITRIFFSTQEVPLSPSCSTMSSCLHRSMIIPPNPPGCALLFIASEFCSFSSGMSTPFPEPSLPNLPGCSTQPHGFSGSLEGISGSVF